MKKRTGQSYATLFVLSSLSCAVLLTFSQAGMGAPVFDRASWVHWRGSWDPNSGPPSRGFLAGGSQYMTCVATDGSGPASEFWAGGNQRAAAQKAYNDCLTFVNVANRNPAYITVECGY